MARKSNNIPEVPAICMYRNLTRFTTYQVTECSYDMAQDILNRLDELTSKFNEIAEAAKQAKIDALKAQLAELEGE